MRIPERARRWTNALMVAFAVLASACTVEGPQSALDPEAPISRRIDRLFDPVFWIAVAVFFLVEGLLVYALIRFRSRSGDRGLPKQVHGNRRLEIAWTIAPALILAGIAVPTVGTIFSLSERPPGNLLEVEVVGHQWWWQVEYPGLEVVTANEIHIPTGRPIYLTLESKDVIHSFWVPKLAGKQDMVPGHVNRITLIADRPGTYLGQCAEYCGASHANMRFQVMAQTPAEFNAWVAGQRQAAVQPGNAAEGARIFAQGQCVGCHTVKGVGAARGIIGPNLTHFGSRSTIAAGILRNTPQNLASWLDDPPRIKPGSRMPDYNLSKEQIAALVAYLESLK